MPLSGKASCPYCENLAYLVNQDKDLQAYKCPSCKNVFMPHERENHFHNWTEYVLHASSDIHAIKPNELCEYPVKYLQDALGGIVRGELIVIGSDTGRGKTELCNQLAFYNAKRGREVYLFSLEGDKYDVANRERYRYIANLYYSSGRNDLQLSYKDFVMNKLDGKIDEFEVAADEFVRKAYQKLHIYTRYKPLDFNILSHELDLIHETADLIIIDHLHYFDIGSNEHTELTHLMKQIQELKSTYRIPIILASHLRKKSDNRVFPDNNDFHGTSNIAKQADTCIILSPIEMSEGEGENVRDGIYPTGIRITKSRYGLSQKLIGIVDFSLPKRVYSHDYQIAVASQFGVVKLDPKEYPKWAKREVSVLEVF
jgi:archaellum biogenesis ATPase FlaH